MLPVNMMLRKVFLFVSLFIASGNDFNVSHAHPITSSNHNMNTTTAARPINTLVLSLKAEVNEEMQFFNKEFKLYYYSVLYMRLDSLCFQ